MKLYMAGPLGFSEAGAAFHKNTLVPMLEKLGYEVLDPWELARQIGADKVASMPEGAERKKAWEQLNPIIGKNNCQAIDACEVMLAVLDGVDIDSGTASEVGYAYARNKRIVGYRGDFRLSADNEGSAVNLQVEYFIRQSGGDIVFKVADIQSALERAIAFKTRL